MKKLKKVKQVYEHYEKWEDYNNSMYTLKDVIDKDKKVIECINLLSNPEDFYKTCIELIEVWNISTDVNLSNTSSNRQAWLGAAACCFKFQAPEYLTRIAWKLLNKDVQLKANYVADKIIKIYERKNTGLHKNMGEQMLF
jgi:hypothetical protein